MSPLSFVNVLQGTHSIREFSTGNTLPLVARPWALHHWTLQTGAAPWTFHPDHRKLWGIRLTHQPSPWMRDYGNILILPMHGVAQEKIEHNASAYHPAQGELHPHYLKANLLRYGLHLEMTPTRRGALFVVTRTRPEPIRIRFHFDGPHRVGRGAEPRGIHGWSANNNGGTPANFALHFQGEFSEPVKDVLPMDNGCILTFAPEVCRVELRLAASFISEEIAYVTLNRELVGRNFETLVSASGKKWEELLNRIEVSPSDSNQARTFYSCLYRCLLFPRFLDEVDEHGREIHYSPNDGGVHEGTLCTDSGFWDTYRTLYPLLALAYPDVLSRMLGGWLNSCRQTGWTPRWPSPGPRDCMIGTHFDVLAADAIAKGVTDWDIEGAFPYLWRDATEPAPDALFGRMGLEDYIHLGYLACDRYPSSVSCTLDYAYDDFCIARVAGFLGRKREEALLLSRSKNYRNVFDSSVGFMRGRKTDGSWLSPFREFTWGGPYVEGGPWQHTFNVPHDVGGLAELFGGSEKLCARLDLMLASPPHFEDGGFGYEIHEMTEMAVAGFGQYAHSNQPVHNFLFLYAQAGQPEKVSYWVHRVASELYSPRTLPGDEDNGEMAAWYVFASMGLFPVCPGLPGYLYFRPLARSVVIHTPKGDIDLARGARSDANTLVG